MVIWLAHQEPSGLTPEAVGITVLDVAVAEPLAVAEGPADEVATLPFPARYQFASGSPIHSPMVTPRYPLDSSRSSI